MNEQIEEIARSIDPEAWRQCHADDIEWCRKFAELIVRECVCVVENLSPGYKDYRNQIEDAFRGHCVAELKHHFGVENERTCP